MVLVSYAKQSYFVGHRLCFIDLSVRGISEVGIAGDRALDSDRSLPSFVVISNSHLQVSRRHVDDNAGHGSIGVFTRRG